jgi:Predicted membrane protein
MDQLEENGITLEEPGDDKKVPLTGKTRLISTVLALQLAIWGLIAMDHMGIDISYIQLLVGTVYFAFVPGLLILKLLRVKGVSLSKAILYTAGLSFIFNMLCGLAANVIFPSWIFNIATPITELPIISLISFFVLAMTAVLYFSKKDEKLLADIDWRLFKFPAAIALIVALPVLSISGTYLVNYYDNNLFLMAMIVLCAIIIFLIGTDRVIPKSLYPIAIYSMSLSLLYHVALMSSYLLGTDIYIEHNLYDLVINNGFWGQTYDMSKTFIADPSNSMLSVTLLPAVYHIFTAADGLWIFRIAYPMAFALVPVGIYCMCCRQIGEKMAFLAVILFVGFYGFFNYMPWLAKQQIAELFLVLIMMVLSDAGDGNSLTNRKKIFLILVFGTGLIVSHYAIGFILIILLVSAIPVLYIMNRIEHKHTISVISFSIVILLVVLSFSWYMFVNKVQTMDSGPIFFIASYIIKNNFV